MCASIGPASWLGSKMAALGCRGRLLAEPWIWPVETLGFIPGDRAVTQDGCLYKERRHTVMDGCEMGWIRPSTSEFSAMEEQDERRSVSSGFGDRSTWISGLWDKL